MRAVRAALLVGAAVAVFALGAITSHYRIAPWPWLYSMFRDSKAALQSVRKKSDDRKQRADGDNKTFAKVIPTGLLNFDFVIHNAGRRIDGKGGGIAVTDEGALIAHSLTGKLYFFDEATQKLELIRLRLPDNNFAKLPEKTPGGRTFRSHRLRYNDLEFIRKNGVLSLLVSYTQFDPDKACFTNRLAIRDLEEGWNAPAADNEAGITDGWKVVFETEPCLPFNEGRKGNASIGHQAGGRLALAADGSIYLTSGDFEFDGRKEGPLYPEIADSDYGKTIRIDPNDWSATKFSLGHRNPQGITIDDQGRIWVVEHGPMGGDELNLIRQGANYGWPSVTLGVNYSGELVDDKRWLPNPRQGRHDNYESPVFAWMPSIGVSNIKQVHDLHPRWDGDLLVTSLREHSLHRLRLAGDRVAYEERIPFRERVRYVDIGKGVIYLLFDNGLFGTLRPRLTPILVAEKNHTPAPADAASEPASEGILVTAGCIECHSSANAPRLAAIVGKPIATQPGVDYSTALLNKKANWTAENLRAFLRDTQGFAPGTQMPDPSLSEDEIEDIIAQLKGDPSSAPPTASAP